MSPRPEPRCSRFTSTAPGSDLSVSASEAMWMGLAPDGRLLVPERLPTLRPEDFDGLEDAASIGAKLLAPFFEADALQDQLGAICAEAFSFPMPLKTLTDDTSVLELFHGPTAAFKDVGARFLASCLSRMASAQARPVSILVATSGDTGGAVAAAFHGKPHVEVIVLYPAQGVSARQERQLTCWRGNITTYAVRGVFDDCQRLVKEAFAHPWWQRERRLSSANSINIGRLLPQMVYYATASLQHWRQRGRRPHMIIPSGNAGNACAALWARACGLPLGQIILATNANTPITDLLDTGVYQPRATLPTLASAMDVGHPSNMERLLHMHPTPHALRAAIRAYSVDDAQIRDQLRRAPRVWQEVWCPHTACAVQVREQLDEDDMIIVATAHPAKFDIIVEPLIATSIPIPEQLARHLHSPNYARPLDEPTLDAFCLAEQRRALEAPDP